MNTPEQFIEQLENQTPAMIFVQQVNLVQQINEIFPGSIPTDEEMNLDAVEGDVNTFSENEGDIT